MIKRRPAIVISPRLPHRDGLCTVVQPTRPDTAMIAQRTPRACSRMACISSTLADMRSTEQVSIKKGCGIQFRQG
jgi:hypothetical protein